MGINIVPDMSHEDDHADNLSEALILTHNESYGSGVARNFFDIYYSLPRLIVETVIAFVAVLANVFVLVLLLKGSFKQKGTAYRILFYNLSITNMLCCALSWMSNNSLLLFERHLVTLFSEPDGMCRVFLCLMSAMFVPVAFGVESSLTMLGFTAVQYRSVSRPLVHWAMARQKMAYVFLVTSWMFTFIFGCVPVGILLNMSLESDCLGDTYDRAMSVVVVSAGIAMGLECLTYVMVIVLSALVYYKLWRYSQGFWNIRFNNQIRNQKRTFGTTLLLFITLVLFSLPYMILYVATLSSDGDVSHFEHTSLIHYMNMLPYFKFLSDPVIYGMRMWEIKETWFRILVKCGLERLAGSRNDYSSPRSPPPYVMNHMTFV